MRAENSDCTPELWVEPGGAPDERPADVICVDIFRGGEDRRLIQVCSGDPPEGAQIETLLVGSVDAKIYPFFWDICFVWMHHPTPQWQQLDPWRRKWLNPHRTADLHDEDGLSGGAHFLGRPTAEGGGYLLEADLGSAPVEALVELIDALVQMGATEIEVGRPDGSDIDPSVLAELQRGEFTRQRLAEIVAQLLRQFEEVQSAEITAPEEVAVLVKGNKHEGKVFTGHLYQRTQRIGAEARAKEVWRFARGQRETHHGHDELPNLNQLRPVIKDDLFFRDIHQRTDGKMRVLARRLVGDLSTCCVWDTPNGMRFVTEDEPQKYGLTSDQAHERALKNYLSSRPEVELVDHAPLLVARTGDCYDASLLLDDAFWNQTAAKVQGELLACVPARDLVLIAGTASPTALGAMRQAATRLQKGGDHLVSTTILIRRDGAWHALPSDPSSPSISAAPPKKKWWRFW